MKPGEILSSRYKIVSEIASGGMATVYKAFDEKLERYVAVKVLHKHLLTDTKTKNSQSNNNFQTRFIKEAKSAAKLISQNIVGVYDQGNDGGIIYLVMEFVEGKTLREVLNETSPLDTKTSLSIIKNVLRGLNVAHKQGIVHRDIKPENVIIQNDGVVKLTDFGLAKAVDDSRATATNTVLGTVAYMSPELVETGDFAQATDIYSVGVVLFEMLTGKTPFSKNSPIQTALEHVKGKVPRLAEIDKSIPQEISGLVEVFTIKDPALRPPDASVALKLLDKATAAADKSDATQILNLDPSQTVVMSLAENQIAKKGFAKRRSLTNPKNESEEGTEFDKGTKFEKGTKFGRGTKFGKGPRFDKGTKFDKGSKKKKLYIVLSIVLAVLLLGGSFFVWNYIGPGAYKQIPGDLIGKTYFEAQIELQNLGINSIRAEDYSDKIPVDKIMTVNPEENSNIKYRDETVTLTVSKGIKYIDFPNSLKDKTTADLANVLTQLGFINIVVENEYSLTVKEGKLIKSSVKEGTKLRWDTKIVLLNSKGPKPITFPNVVGQTQTNAKTVLEALSLKVEVKTSYSDDVKKGLVISQDPSASAKGFEGQQITITVSLGPPITTVPNVVGLSVSQAHEKLRAANLKWTDTGVSVLGLVQKQSVSGGQTVNIGATITLTIV